MSIVNDTNFKTRKASTILNRGQKQIEIMEAQNIVNMQKAEQGRKNLEADKITCDNNLIQDIKDSANSGLLSFRKIATLCSVMSVILSVGGIAKVFSFRGILNAFNGEYGLFAVAMLIAQVAIVTFNTKSSSLAKYHNKDYRSIKIMARLVLLVSITCNYIFMINTIGDSNLFYKVVGLVLASSFDVISLTFSRASYNMINRQYSYPGEEEDSVSWFEKIIVILFGDLMVKINKSYANKMELLKESKTQTTKNIQNENTSNENEKCVNSTSKFYAFENGKTTSIEGKKGVCDVFKNEENEELENAKGKTLIHTSNARDIKNYKDLESKIAELDEGTILTPSTVNMQGDKNYYNWIKKCSNVNKINGKYVKVKPAISLVKH